MTDQNQGDIPENRAVSKTGRPITQADIDKSIQEILEFIGTDGIASLENLHRKFWGLAGMQSSRRFLSLLEKEGWLERHFIHAYKPGQLVFTLTAKGARKFFGQVERKNLMIGLPANSEIKQQLLAQQARLELEKQLALEGKQLIEWQNERHLRRETIRNIRSGISTLYSLNDIADARMTVKTREGQIYRQEIEIDGEYYGQMLKNKIETYRQKAVPVVWVTLSNRAYRIKRELTEAGATNISLLVLDIS